MIPYGKQWVNEDDIRAVNDVLRGDWLTCGPVVTAFEEAVAARCGARYAVAVANGTAALHLACLALGVKPGDAGVTSPLSFLASANGIAYCGGRPDFVDIEAASRCMSVDALEDYILRNGAPRVVIPVDFAGVPADLPAIRLLAEKYRFAVIEDAAHALGSRYCVDGKWYSCGCCAHTDLAIMSFHPVKTITCGEGGMVLTNDAELAQRVRKLANHGIERDPERFVSWQIDADGGIGVIEDNETTAGQSEARWLYQQQELGFNYRLSDIHCALGLSQLQRLDGFIKRRGEIVERYNQAFAECEGVALPPCPANTAPAYHLYVLRLPGASSARRRRFIDELRQRGVLTQVHYLPIHLQPWYQKHFGYKAGKCPLAEELYHEILSIPLYPLMNDDEIDLVIVAVKVSVFA